MKRTYFDPHPGFAGAATVIPEPVRLVANEMNGKSYEDDEALRLIQEAAPAGFELELITYKDKTAIGGETAEYHGDGMLILRSCGNSPPPYPINEWRVLKWHF